VISTNIYLQQFNFKSRLLFSTNTIILFENNSFFQSTKTYAINVFKSFLFSVIAVINKVKPSYLVDGIVCSPAQLCQLVQYIGSHCPTQIDGLTVLHFPGGDLVVTDVEQCLLNVQESFKCFQNGLLSSRRNLQVVQAFINITSTLKKPHVIYKQTDHGYEEIKRLSTNGVLLFQH